jgi:hypothetical protein
MKIFEACLELTRLYPLLEALLSVPMRAVTGTIGSAWAGQNPKTGTESLSFANLALKI